MRVTASIAMLGRVAARSASAASAAGGGSGGRLVLTHSTHVESLIPALRIFAASPLVVLVVPGRLAFARGAAPGLAIRVSVATAGGGGYKLLARKGSQVQEVFVTVRGGAAAVPPAMLQAELHRLLPRAAAGPPPPTTPTTTATREGAPASAAVGGRCA